MIVVAIIGILAAVAIPGFMQYIKSSKTSEAKTNVKAIADGAVSYFEAEHDFAGDGMKPETKVYPGKVASKKWTAAKAAHVGSYENVGAKSSPADYEDTLKAAPWKDLKFNINGPFYYEYMYESKGTVGNSTFTAGAMASLSEAGDSGYKLTGTNAGIVGNLIEIDKTSGITETDILGAATKP